MAAPGRAGWATSICLMYLFASGNMAHITEKLRKKRQTEKNSAKVTVQLAYQL